jgi:hypothetical protein
MPIEPPVLDEAFNQATVTGEDLRPVNRNVNDRHTDIDSAHDAAQPHRDLQRRQLGDDHQLSSSRTTRHQTGTDGPAGEVLGTGGALRFVRTQVPADEITQCFEVPPPELHGFSSNAAVVNGGARARSPAVPWSYKLA